MAKRFVRAFDELLLRADQLIKRNGVLCGCTRTSSLPDIVDAFHQGHPLHAGLCQHIAIEASQSVAAGAIAQETIPGNPLIYDRNLGRRLTCLQALCQQAWPAVVGIRRGRGAVRDRVAERHQRRRGYSGIYPDPTQQRAAVQRLRVRQLRCASPVAFGDVAGLLHAPVEGRQRRALRLRHRPPHQLRNRQPVRQRRASR